MTTVAEQNPDAIFERLAKFIPYPQNQLIDALIIARCRAILAESRPSTEPPATAGGATSDSASDDAVGEAVRVAWVKWARTQPNPKPSWLVPWSELNETDREADRRIGRALYDAGFSAGERAERERNKSLDAGSGGSAGVATREGAKSGAGDDPALFTPAQPPEPVHPPAPPPVAPAEKCPECHMSDGHKLQCSRQPGPARVVLPAKLDAEKCPEPLPEVLPAGTRWMNARYCGEFTGEAQFVSDGFYLGPVLFTEHNGRKAEVGEHGSILPSWIVWGAELASPYRGHAGKPTRPCPALERLSDRGCLLPAGHSGQHRYWPSHDAQTTGTADPDATGQGAEVGPVAPVPEVLPAGTRFRYWGGELFEFVTPAFLCERRWYGLCDLLSGKTRIRQIATSLDADGMRDIELRRELSAGRDGGRGEEKA